MSDIQPLNYDIVASTMLTGIEHFAMPTVSIAQLEPFVRQILGGIPYYYAGYDDLDRKMLRPPHIFMRIGEILFQCTEEAGPMTPRPDDPCLSPHWAFGIEPDWLGGFIEHLQAEHVPFMGPIHQQQHGGRSIYFMSPEGHKFEVCELRGSGNARQLAETDIDWRELAHNWRSDRPLEPIKNINPIIGARNSRTDNSFGLTAMHHFTLPVKNPELVEAFLMTFLDAERIGNKPLMIGRTAFECTVEPQSRLYPVPKDMNVAPHWSFGTSAVGLDRYKQKIMSAGIFVAGPYRHRSVDLVSIYFKSPEGHKFEIGTWDAYPEEKAGLMGAPGVGLIPWNKLDHDWRPNR